MNYTKKSLIRSGWLMHIYMLMYIIYISKIKLGNHFPNESIQAVRVQNSHTREKNLWLWSMIKCHLFVALLISVFTEHKWPHPYWTKEQTVVRDVASLQQARLKHWCSASPAPHFPFICYSWLMISLHYSLMAATFPVHQLQVKCVMWQL